MSIADKLKKTLTETNFFKKSVADKSEKSTIPVIEIAKDEEIEFSEPVETNIVSINPKTEKVNKFEDLAMELVNKIKKTPYWTEFSMKSQEKMISKYFDKKIKTPKYVEIPYSLTDKLTFIEEVLKSVV